MPPVYSLWGLLAAAALLWPDHISGPFDGVPLDRVAEAVLVAGVLPALWYLASRIPRDFPRARVHPRCLVAWRVCSALLFVQDGWCVRFEPARPFAKDAAGAPHAWDMRADWRSPDPACSAIMTRSYQNSPISPPGSSTCRRPTTAGRFPADRPPAATVAMRVHGFLDAPEAGVLQIDTGPTSAPTVSVDGVALDGPSPVGRGLHFVSIDAVLTGDRWALVPRWNGQEIWSRVTTTVRRPSPFDLAARPLDPLDPDDRGADAARVVAGVGGGRHRQRAVAGVDGGRVRPDRRGSCRPIASGSRAGRSPVSPPPRWSQSHRGCASFAARSR